MRWISAAAMIFALCAACDSSTRRGGSGDGGAGGCVDVSGGWTIADHCTAELEGVSLSASQTGCTFTVSGPFEGFEGKAGGGGAVEISGTVEGETISCTGTATTSSMDLTCNGDCTVRLVSGGDA